MPLSLNVLISQIWSDHGGSFSDLQHSQMINRSVLWIYSAAGITFLGKADLHDNNSLMWWDCGTDSLMLGFHFSCLAFIKSWMFWLNVFFSLVYALVLWSWFCLRPKFSIQFVKNPEKNLCIEFWFVEFICPRYFFAI